MTNIFFALQYLDEPNHDCHFHYTKRCAPIVLAAESFEPIYQNNDSRQPTIRNAICARIEILHFSWSEDVLFEVMRSMRGTLARIAHRGPSGKRGPPFRRPTKPVLASSCTFTVPTRTTNQPNNQA